MLRPPAVLFAPVPVRGPGRPEAPADRADPADPADPADGGVRALVPVAGRAPGTFGAAFFAVAFGALLSASVLLVSVLFGAAFFAEAFFAEAFQPVPQAMHARSVGSLPVLHSAHVHRPGAAPLRRVPQMVQLFFSGPLNASQSRHRQFASVTRGSFHVPRADRHSHRRPGCHPVEDLRVQRLADAGGG